MNFLGRVKEIEERVANCIKLGDGYVKATHIAKNLL